MLALKPRWWWLYLGFALGLGGLAGYVDTVNAEVQAPAILIVLAAGLLGALDPRRTWLWALVIGLSIPSAHLAAWLKGGPPPAETQVLPMIVLPVIFAFVAALGGALARWALAPQGASHEH